MYWKSVAVTLSFLAVLVLAGSLTAQSVPQHFQFKDSTQSSYSIIIDDAPSCGLVSGDEIGVFDGDLCVGASVYQGTWPLPLTAWEDDTQTPEKDGYDCGNTMSFRVWHSATDIELPVDSVIYTMGDGTFCSGFLARCTLICGCVDVDPPEINCPPDTSVDCAGPTDPDHTGYPTVSDDCSLPENIIVDYTDGQIDNVITRIWEACDETGNCSSCVQIITLVDSVPPAINCPPDIAIECDESTHPDNTGYATATDNCDPDPSVSYTDDQQGNTIIRTWTATDNTGNTSDSCTQTITIQDTQPPQAICPGDTVVPNDPDECGAIVEFTASVTDNCPGATVSCSPPSGSFFPVGITTVTCIAEDVSGNTDTCEFTVTVEDTELPVVNCPADTVILIQPEDTGAIVEFTVLVTDNCPGATVMCDPPSGSFFPVGTTMVTCFGVDGSANVDTCTFEVKVELVFPPVAQCTAVTVEADANCEADASIDNGSYDPDGQIDSMVQEPPSPYPLGETVVLLIVTDNDGLKDSCEAVVTVVDVTPPAAMCPSDMVVPNDPGECGAIVEFTASVTDNCPGATVNCNPASGSFFPVGITTVTCIAEDAADNADTCSFTVTVEDTEHPVADCPGDTAILIQPEDTGATVEFTASVSDNCPGATVSCQPYSGSFFPVGITMVTCIAEDALGNADTCDFTVTVNSGGVTPTNEWINVYCSDPTLNGVPLMPSDVIVAYDPDGVACGIDTVREDGSFGYMPIYRDDIYSEEDEGAEPGDVIAFKINGEEVFPELPVVWTFNGDEFEVCEFTTERCVEIFLHEGWNLISWNVAYSAGIDEIMAQLAKSTCVEVILSFDQGALTYDPGLPDFSTLLDVDYYHAYWFKMNCDATLEICGFPIEPDEVIVIYSGWNLVSYWPDDTLSVEEGFVSILDNLLVALGYDYGGLTWLPGDTLFNTLTELKPLFGYWAKSSADDMLAYPGFNPVVAAPKDESGSQIAAAGVAPSRSWMSLYGSGITLDGVELASHSLIEVYTHDGVLCGSGHYTDGLLKFTPVYGYDPMSEVTTDYPKDGDPVTLYINGTRVYPNVEWAGHSSRVRINQVFSTAAGAGLVPDHYALLQNYPNPFNPTTEIVFTLPAASRVSLDIYNVLGQRVTTLVEGVLEAGEHIVQWDVSEVSSGIYFYRLQADDFIETKKMVLLK